MGAAAERNCAPPRIDYGHVQSGLCAICANVSACNGGRPRDPAFELIVSSVRDEIELGRAIAVAGRQQSGDLIALPDSFLNSRHEMIVALTAKQHLPAIYSVSEFTRSGGLIAYGIERADLFRRSAAYVDRILKGEKAADLAVQ